MGVTLDDDTADQGGRSPSVPEAGPLDDVILQISAAWRTLRRGGSSTAIREQFFGGEPTGVDVSQVDVLDVLVRRPAWRMSESSAVVLHVDPSTATRGVQRLADRGLVERLADSADGRVVQVRATATGRAAFDRYDARRRTVIAELLESFTAAEQMMLGELLTRFVAALDQMAAGGPDTADPDTADPDTADPDGAR